MPNPIFVALDTADPGEAVALARRLADRVGGIKLGLEFFAANGPAAVRRVAAEGMPVFLDLKLHDIPNTVAGAVRGATRLGPAMTTLHASGGLAMMKAAADAAADEAAKQGVPRPLLLAVTVLTSLAETELASIGWTPPVADQVKRLAALAREAGMDGIVCSPHEVGTLRALLGPDMTLVIPGIRPAWAATDDQKRVMTPAEAIAQGADVLVIGRPITRADDPAAAAARILAELP